jgi:hypothetical protein
MVFGLFKPQKFFDPQFGELLRSRSYWRGSIDLDAHRDIAFAIAGSKNAPDAGALAEFRQSIAMFAQLTPVIAQALHEHFEPYGEAIAMGEYPEADQSLRNITSPEIALSRAKLVFITVRPIGGQMMTEFGFEAEWDEEHRLGLFFQGGKFFELCGSTVPA